MPLKPLTEEQRAAAREKAKKARVIRAEMKEAVKNKQITISEVLQRAETDEAVARLKVTDLLTSLPGVGEVRTENILKDLNIAASRRLRGLGIHQRRALINLLDR
ncbi:MULTISPECIES: integration host factor, actinobacterial type [Rothia]|uniref:Integration host factor, actinobacterial type n=1 Tax=Rothia endophytica TaxID=1324766 RepID=A0ABP9BE77_9MICC|nr:integration host factor, actinobacterial type [Rothia sp. P100]MCM3510541.1 DNA-binding protein [Rothia sp. P100]SLF10857.1 MIHF [Mycobacteroides abscessus subsp. bolletii]